MRGIHRHVDPGVRIRYLADAKREQVGAVELTEEDGSRHRFEPKGGPPADARWARWTASTEQLAP